MKLQYRQKLLAIVALAAVGLLAGDRLLFTPLVGLWKARSVELSRLRENVRHGTQLMERDAVLKAQWRSMQTNALPAEASVAENQLLRAFDRWSQDTRVSVNSVKPQWKTAAGNYTTLECRVDANGNLSALTRFLHNLERDALAVKVETVDITARDDNGELLTLGLQVSGLVLNEKLAK
jgi:hypothetical protein